MKKILRLILIVVFAGMAGIIGIPIFMIARDMITHDRRLAQRSQLIDRWPTRTGDEIVFRHDEVGLIFGNGNHTDYWVVRIVKVSGDPEQAIAWYKKQADAKDIGWVIIDRLQTLMDDQYLSYDIKRIGADRTCLPYKDKLVLQYQWQEDAGMDPRSH